MAKSRSPNYPAFGLPKALSLVQRVYDKEHLHKAAPDVVAKALGYSGLNGASLTTISALKKYRLLEEVGSDLKVSAGALTILVDPKDSSERAKAIQQAAFAPVLFAEIRKQYGDSAPSDENLRSFLLKKGFLQTAVDAPIRAYRETLGLVSTFPRADTGEIQSHDQEGEEMHQTDTAGQGAAQTHSGQAVKVDQGRADVLPKGGKQVGSSIPVTKNCAMSVVATGDVTQEGLEKLIQYLNLIKGSFPETDETIQ